MAAALLKRGGHHVIGVGMVLFRPSSGRGQAGGCCGMADMEDARRVARKIDMPFHVINYRQAFETEVVDYFCRSYMEGRTPNPCIVCNERLKFGRLLHVAEAAGADHLATGHYARIGRDPRAGRALLRKGADPRKDQSYFLYALSQPQLRRAIFPLGQMSKQETRRMARELDLPVADKPATQDLCFVGPEGYRGFLRERAAHQPAPGPVVDTAGRVLGQHRGIGSYTVGQRRGLGIAAEKPLYVLKLDSETNTIVVGHREELLTRRFTVGRLNWLAVPRPPAGARLGVKTRYGQQERSAIIQRASTDRICVILDEPQARPAPGQAAVFYDAETVLGGGVIEE